MKIVLNTKYFKRILVMGIVFSLVTGVLPMSPFNETQAATDGYSQLETDYAALKFSVMIITEDLSLATKGKSGSSIEWNSSDETVISTTGEVSRPKAGTADKEVTLTAKLSYEGKERFKIFVFTVLAESILPNVEQFRLDEVKVLDDYYLTAQTADIGF